MLYAGRPFDSTDRDILFKNVRQCGIGKVIIGINKYDIPYGNGETEEQIRTYVKDELRKACVECKDNTLVEIIQQVEPITLSAEMALLSEIPMSRVSSKEEYQCAWKRHCDTFEISTQKEMFEKSHLNHLTNAVRDVIAKEKDEIMLAKPMNAILAAGNKKKSGIETELGKLQMLLVDLEKPDDELDERIELLDKAERRLNKKIDCLGEDLEIAFKDLVRKGRNEMEDMVDRTCREMDSEIEGLGLFQNVERIIPTLEGKLQTLVTRTLKRYVEELGLQGKSKIHNAVTDFINDAEEVLVKFVPEFDSQEFVKRIKKEIDIDIEDRDVFSFDASVPETDDEYGFWNGVYDFMNGYSLGTLTMLTNAFSHGETVNKLHSIVNGIKADFDPEPYLNSIFGQKDVIIEKVKDLFIIKLIDPLQKQVQEIKANKGEKEKTIKETRSLIESLAKEKQTIEEQQATIN